MHRLRPSQYDQARSVFEVMNYNLAVQAILDGSVPAEIYVDDPTQPRVAFTSNGQRHYLAGSSGNREFNRFVRRRLVDTGSPSEDESGHDLFLLYYETAPAWEETLNTLLRDSNPIRSEREYYAVPTGAFGDRAASPSLPEEFSLHYVDEELLSQKHLENLDDLIQELCSERQSVQDFLDKSFGFCLLHGDSVAGWCLSEYNTAGRCEVGIATFPPHRRRGLASDMASALLAHAPSEGISHVGWHCYASNLGSAATARKAGFVKTVEYPVRLAYLDQTINLAVHGNIAFQQGRHGEAVKNYQKAIPRGDAPTWVYWNAACTSALVGQPTAALDYLDQALDNGFDDLDRLLSSEHLSSLHDLEGWQALVERLEETIDTAG